MCECVCASASVCVCNRAALQVRRWGGSEAASRWKRYPGALPKSLACRVNEVGGRVVQDLVGRVVQEGGSGGWFRTCEGVDARVVPDRRQDPDEVVACAFKVSGLS